MFHENSFGLEARDLIIILHNAFGVMGVQWWNVVRLIPLRMSIYFMTLMIFFFFFLRRLRITRIVMAG
jgi:hypothetical protein